MLLGAIVAVAAAVDAFAAGVVVGKKYGTKIEAEAAKEVEVVLHHNTDHVAKIEAEIEKVVPASAVDATKTKVADLLAQAQANAPKA